MHQNSVPTLRFKDKNGAIFPEWHKKDLGSIGEIVNGLTYSPSEIDKSGVLVLRSSNVKNRTIIFNDSVYVNTKNYNAVKAGDILICVRNGSKRLIGKNAIISSQNEGSAFGAFMTVYRSDFNKFLFHWFDSDDYKNKVHRNLGATINSINGSDLKKFAISLPCTEEQKKIASFLTSVDSKIEKLTRKKELLEVSALQLKSNIYTLKNNIRKLNSAFLSI